MKVFVLLALLGVALAQDDCPAFVKQGCLSRDANVFHQQVANNRDASSNVYTGKLLDWHNFKQSLGELGCACAKKVKELGGVAFAMTFWGECWMATDKAAYEAHLMNPADQSGSCIGHDGSNYGSCAEGHGHCMADESSEYAYSFPSAAPPAIDGGFGNWSEWTQCSASCGDSFQERERSCNNPVPKNGGADCPEEELTETRKCDVPACPVDGKWTEYSEFGECSASCGGGSQKRTRSCTNPAPAHGGKECEGSDEDERECGTDPCPVDGKWTEYSEFGECSASCGGGSQKRTRSCTNPAPAHGGKECEGSDEDEQECGTDPCPVDGKWGAYGAFSQCNKPCGGGSQSRSRSCNNPAPKYGGKACVGSATDSRACNTQNCPVDGKWGAYGAFSQCNKPCGGGSQSRSRSCNNPAPKYGGKACVGSATDSRACNTQNCPINGKWGSWSGYGSCNKKCGTGSQTRTRSCNNPSPKYNGASCSGSSQQSRNCNTHSCYSGYMEFKTCEGSSRNVDCGSGKVIKLQDYFWGRTSKSYCRSGVDWFWSTSCRGGHGRIANRCHNRQSCKLEANNSWMNDDPCWGTPKYAWVKYRCYQSPY
uniref:SUEL-type lectin domain-containing protein n=1 Tax=Clytia hemisphaerica TaxID=252671 RepID=A0A7M5XCK5_9CNID